MNATKPLFALVCTMAAAVALGDPIYLDSRSNIFGYGVGTPAPGGGGGGLVAPTLALAPGTTSLTFSVTGSAGWSETFNNGPDGGTFANTTNIPAVGPISGYSAPLSGHLVGLFIPSGDISGLSAPAGMSYLDLASFTQTSYAPGLRQVFFIGDGLTGTGSGTRQTFVVPAGASKLVLGIADAYSFNASAGYYDDNLGGFTVNPVPEPASLAALGLGALAVLRRRKRV